MHLYSVSIQNLSKKTLSATATLAGGARHRALRIDTKLRRLIPAHHRLLVMSASHCRSRSGGNLAGRLLSGGELDEIINIDPHYTDSTNNTGDTTSLGANCYAPAVYRLPAGDRLVSQTDGRREYHRYSSFNWHANLSAMRSMYRVWQ